MALSASILCCATEDTMSSIQTMDGHASHRPDTAPVDQKLEVVIIPVSDVDRAKKFYEGLAAGC